MIKLDPNWLTGFINGKGCFAITISRYPQLKTGRKVIFWLGLNEKDRALTWNLFKNFSVELEIFLNNI